MNNMQKKLQIKVKVNPPAQPSQIDLVPLKLKSGAVFGYMGIDRASGQVYTLTNEGRNGFALGQIPSKLKLTVSKTK